MNGWIKRITDNGILDSTPQEDAVRIRILNVICVLAILVICVLYSFRDVLFGRYTLALFHFLLVVDFIPPLIFNYFRKHNLARLYIFILFPISIIPYNYYLSDIGAENYLFSLVLLSFLLLERTSTKFIISFYCAMVFIFIKYLLKNDLSLAFYEDSADELFYFNTSQSFIMVTIFSFVYSYQNKLHHKRLVKANEELQESNRLVKSLLKELNHRVKNNLQMISSLFNIQSLGAEDPNLRLKLSEAKNRMQALSMVYEKLYTGKVNFEINLKEYILQQFGFLTESFFGGRELTCEVEIPHDLSLGVEESIHIGLIINELITNVHKYASSDHTHIHLCIIREEKKLRLQVADNGPGFPANFDPESSGGFGYELIRILVQKYNGSLEINNTEGTRINILLDLSGEQKASEKKVLEEWLD